jgi:hypothetical protein
MAANTRTLIKFSPAGEQVSNGTNIRPFNNLEE